MRIMDKILLIDAHNYIYRGMVFFNLPEDSIKENIMAYNFFKNIRATVEQFNPNKVFLVWEGNPKFRYALYPEYKANRIVKTGSKQESKDIFNRSKTIIKDICRFMPFAYAYANNYEADDVISTLVEDLKDEDVTIISSDSDYIQLLQKDYNVKLYNPRKKEFEQAPNYPYVIWKCLAGDKSDNIKSLVYPSKVIKMLEDKDLFSKFLDVEENRANFNINQKLIEFANVPKEEIIIENNVIDFDRVQREFKSFEFNSILNKWDKFVNTFKCINY